MEGHHGGPQRGGYGQTGTSTRGAQQGPGASNGGRKSVRGDAGLGHRVKSAEQARTSGKATHSAVVRGARDGVADSTGGHGETGASHAETPAGYLGELAGSR